MAAVAAVVVVGLGQRTGAAEVQPYTLSEARERLQGAPPALAALHADANEILPGGRRAFRERLEALEGRPVVINKWAAWCGPCRIEAPFLNVQGVERGDEVAFLGVDWRDNASDARAFLQEVPLPFPSYSDPDGEIARMLEMPENATPVTLFLDEEGEVAYLRQGGYATAADLAADIDRYLSAP